MVNKRIPMWAFLLTAAIAYSLAYIFYPAVPERSHQYPEGWWGWFDQGQYLRAATAFLHRDLSPQNFYYPPLYPLIGAAFLPLFPNHPYFLFDGAAFVLFVYAFIKFANRYISSVEIAAILIITLFTNRTIMSQFAIPWTTTGTIALYSLALLELTALRDKTTVVGSNSCPQGALNVFVFSAIFGLIMPLRPVDSGLAAVFFPGYLYFDWKQAGTPALTAYWRRCVAVCVFLGFGFAIGVGLFAVYNILVFGSPLGGYIQSTASASGYFPSQLPRKAFSLVFDSYTVFLEPRASFVTHYLWLLLALFGIALAILAADALTRIVAIAIVLHFLLYAPYGDLLPIGVWRYNNVHYFKWMLPYLGFFAWLTCRWVVMPWRTNRGVSSKRLASVAIAVLALLMLQFSVNGSFARVKPLGNPPGKNGIEIIVPTQQRMIDFIDLPGANGGFSQVYFGEHHVKVDGKDLIKVRDFRLIPAPNGARLIFNQPISGRTIIFYPDPGINLTGIHPTVQISTYHFTIGRPHLLHDIAR